MRARSSRRTIPSILFAFFLALRSVWAATFTWDGGSAIDSNWTTAANWNPDGAPANDGTADLF